ncbi:MAG TPA: cyclic nucleotide-binding domain-containing protein [Gaiellaceae bacterium]
MPRPVPHVPRSANAVEQPSDPKEWINVLAEVPLFSSLSTRHLRHVAALAKIRRFHDGAVMMRAGDAGDAMYVLLDGRATARVSRGRAVGIEMGAFVGELALLDDGPRTATVVANGPVIALSVTRAGFRKLLRSEPSIAVAIAEELARRLRTARTIA